MRILLNVFFRGARRTMLWAAEAPPPDLWMNAPERAPLEFRADGAIPSEAITIERIRCVLVTKRTPTTDERCSHAVQLVAEYEEVY